MGEDDPPEWFAALDRTRRKEVLATLHQARRKQWSIERLISELEAHHEKLKEGW